MPKRAAAEVPSLLRRAPQRERGHARVERLLEAAADVIGEVGVEAASTNAIAARAGASVGSLYQYFPNKDALVQALAARYVADFGRLKDRVFALEVADRPLPAMMRGIVAPLAAFVEGNPAYQHVVAATARDPGAVSKQASLHATVVASVERLIARRMPRLSPARRRAIATVQVEAVHSVIFRAQGLAKEERQALYDELVRMIVAALEPLDPR